MKLIIGIAIGAAVTYYMMGGDTATVSATVKNSVHSVASEVATATEPEPQDRLGDFFDSLTGGK